MAEAPLAGHESADERFHGRRDLGLGEQFERLTLGPEKAPELCDAAQRRFLACDLLDRDLARGEARRESTFSAASPSTCQPSAMSSFALMRTIRRRAWASVRNASVVGVASPMAIPIPSAANRFQSASRGESTRT